MHQTLDQEIEKAVLVGVITQEQREDQVEEYLDELAFLAETAGAESVKRVYSEAWQASPKNLCWNRKVTRDCQLREPKQNWDGYFR